MPHSEFAEYIHRTKYRGDGESFREAMTRVASALKDGDDHFHALREILIDQRFLPGGRVQSAMGSLKGVTPYNCFVSGRIEDSLYEGNGSITSRFKEAMRTMQMGGGIGYDFSTLRPKGALIKKLGSQSGGPVSFMEVYDAGCRCIASAGHRRGAQMGVMRVDHPDIEQFIHAKQPDSVAEPIQEMLTKCEYGSDDWMDWYNLLQHVLKFSGFNVSVAVTDEFMEAVERDADFNLRFNGETYKTVRATSLWDMIMRSTWHWAEPGVLFIDRINDMNNLGYCETIAATNPCGEQPLPPYGACLLGSFNLAKYVKMNPCLPKFGDVECSPSYVFDWEQLEMDIPHVVRAMDNVVDRAIYPLYEQEQEAKLKRRMGLGVTGVANAFEALGEEYGSLQFCSRLEIVLKMIANGAYKASAELAKEKGAFPLYNKGEYLNSRFIQRLDFDTREIIERNGIRNSHLTSIAPTGTISLTADNVSSGIEPVFAYEIERTIQEFDGPKQVKIVDYGVHTFGIRGKRSQDVTVEEHLRVLTSAYKYVDSAVSKTCNVPPDTSWDDFKKIYVDAWKSGCKGCTTFMPGGKRAGVMTSADDDGKACRIDPETGRRECE